MTANAEPITTSVISYVSVLWCVALMIYFLKEEELIINNSSADRVQVAICFRLPFELWSLIFDVFADLRDTYQDFVRNRAIASRVCLMWRAVIIDTPSLWSQLDIGIATSSEWVLVVLARCRNLPITLYRPPRHSLYAV
jgi:hypothetical protein